MCDGESVVVVVIVKCVFGRGFSKRLPRYRTVEVEEAKEECRDTYR